MIWRYASKTELKLNKLFWEQTIPVLWQKTNSISYAFFLAFVKTLFKPSLPTIDLLTICALTPLT